MFFEYEREKPKTIEGYQIIQDGNLIVSPSTWNEMRSRFSKVEIINYIKEQMRIHQPRFPLREISPVAVRKDWNVIQNSFYSEYIEGSWNAPKQVVDFEYKYLGKEIYFPGSYHGMKVSDQFAQIERVKCGSAHGDSPWDEWYGAPEKNSTFLRCGFGLMDEIVRKRGLCQKTLFDSLKMHTYLASQFKPAVAKAFYEFFRAKDVLDFSSGWGDRLVGFHASNARSYTGIDPNSKMHPHYKAITRYCNTGKDVRLFCSPAEDTDLSGVEVDFIFTSPPYFNIEKYSTEGTQSWQRYKTSDAWTEGFLKPTLTNVWGALKEGGRIAVNIADKKGVDICSPMFSHMESLGGTYEGVLGYKMNKRPDSEGKHDSDYIFCEPVFIWAKGDAPEPLWHQETYFDF